MGLKVDGPPPGAERWYTPEFGGNRDDEEPTRVLLRNPTEAQKREFHRDVEVTPDGTVKLSNSDLWAKVVLKICVVRVENYTGADGNAIETAEDLYHHGHTEVALEVATEAATGLSIGEDSAKKSDAPSGSTQADTRRSVGVATTADATSSTAPAAADPEKPASASLPSSVTSSTVAPKHGSATN